MVDLSVVSQAGPWQQLTPEAAQVADDQELGAHLDTFGTRGISPDKIHRTYRFANGLIRQDHGREPEAFRWDEIVTVHSSVADRYYNNRYDATYYTYKLDRDDGASIKISAYHKGQNGAGYRYFEFGTEVCEYVARAQLPGARATLERDGSLDFGKVRLSADGFGVGRHRVPWASIAAVDVEKGWLHVTETGRSRPFFKRAVGQVPNYALFMTLVRTRRVRECVVAIRKEC
jgi:hypothetical protein